MMTPKVDYKLLGKALGEYEKRGYQYVEVPWTVTEACIRATLPETCPAFAMAIVEHQAPDTYHEFGAASRLVGSAEQGFLSLDLKPGAYVGVTPCFRYEPTGDDFLHRTAFMKVELFVRIPFDKDEANMTPGTAIDHVLTDAQEVMGLLAGRKPEVVTTPEGFDLEIGGIEVGSYGERTFQEQRWLYGTGLALPRFSVANAIAAIT